MVLNFRVGWLLGVPWTARRSNQSILKEISPKYSLEGLTLKLKLQYFGHLLWRTDSFEKTLILGKIEGKEEKGMTEDEMAGWHHQLNGHGFGWTLGVGNGQGGLACCGSWGSKESDMTERLNWTELTVLWPPGEDSMPIPDKMEQGIAVFSSFWADWDVCKSFWPHQSLAAKTQGSAPDYLRRVLGKYSEKSGKWGDVAFYVPF